MTLANRSALRRVVPKILTVQQLLVMVVRKDIVDKEIKTTPELVQESNLALFHARWNLPQAAVHCGMTRREMKMTFREFLKYYHKYYQVQNQLTLNL
jgi:hypothetical protein